MFYPLFAMNSTVIHGIFAKLFFSKSDNFDNFTKNSKFEKENSLSAYQNSLSVFDLAERQFSFSNLEFFVKLSKLSKLSLFEKNNLAKIPCITVEFMANRYLNNITCWEENRSQY